MGISPFAHFAFAVVRKAQLSYVAIERLHPAGKIHHFALRILHTGFLLLWVFRLLLTSHSLSFARLNYPTSPLKGYILRAKFIILPFGFYTRVLNLTLEYVFFILFKVDLRRHGQVVRQEPAKLLPPVRIRVSPFYFFSALSLLSSRNFFFLNVNSFSNDEEEPQDILFKSSSLIFL